MNKILVLGKNGQLASALRELDDDNEWTFLGSDELDLSKTESILGKLGNHKFNFLINCAAYTAVDDAEENAEMAFKINAEALGPISMACCEQDAALVHISTDYVFGPGNSTPLQEDQAKEPIGVYGKTKLQGEETIQSICKKHFIIRTSWLYGHSGHNFLNTMLRLSETKDELNVVFDQVGTPTYVAELASAIRVIVNNKDEKYGTYHFSNEGVCSWFDFAHAIFELSQRKVALIPVLSQAFPTKAKRPNYSVLDKQKIRDTFDLDIPHWRDSLKKCLIKKNILDE
jgi:dTDP-4-dehydrorhamnose reductase